MNQQEMNSARPYFRELEAKEREACVNAIPKVRLAEKHMRNCELLLNRARLLTKLPRWAITAELGVDHAAFSEEILKDPSARSIDCGCWTKVSKMGPSMSAAMPTP